MRGTDERKASLALTRSCVDKAMCRTRRMRHLSRGCDIHTKAVLGYSLAQCFVLVRNWACAHVLRWVGWSRISRLRVHMCGHEQIHSEVQLVSCCCGLEAEVDHLVHPRHMAGGLGTRAPSQEGYHSFAACGAVVDSLLPVAPRVGRDHTESPPRAPLALLARNASVADQYG